MPSGVLFNHETGLDPNALTGLFFFHFYRISRFF